MPYKSLTYLTAYLLSRQCYKRQLMWPRPCRCCRGHTRHRQIQRASSQVGPFPGSTAASVEDHQTVQMDPTLHQCLQWTPVRAPAQTDNSYTHTHTHETTASNLGLQYKLYVSVLCYCISFHHFNVFVENFTSYVTLYLYVCWCHGLPLPDLIKKLVTYLHYLSVITHFSYSYS